VLGQVPGCARPPGGCQVPGVYPNASADFQGCHSGGLTPIVRKLRIQRTFESRS
jgi:hypothetical protein